jgi:outer membrane protein assembly factor BamD
MQELYKEAYSFYKNKSYYRAKPRFEEIIKRDPLDKYAVLSELHLADILYEKKDYDNSIIHYEEHLRLNPKTAVYEYLLYKIGMCHFNMICTFDRDQTETDLALAEFDEYIEQFPQGKYKDEVTDNMEEALSTKLNSEYYVGMFYYKMKSYDSAVVRFENIIYNYRKGDLLEESYYILSKSLDKLFKEDKLRSIYDDYLVDFPQGKYKDEIYKLIEEQS